MADDNQTPTANGNSNEAQDGEKGEFRVLGQYIKDLSFENPNAPVSLQNLEEKPKLDVEVNVNARKVGEDTYESAIDFKAKASSKDGIIYSLETVYSGVFRIANIPDQMLQPFLLINCPSILFPFLRRLIADLTREGGYPPLLLDPIDFASLYTSRAEQVQAGEGEGEPKVAN